MKIGKISNVVGRNVEIVLKFGLYESLRMKKSHVSAKNRPYFHWSSFHKAKKRENIGNGITVT